MPVFAGSSTSPAQSATSPCARPAAALLGVHLSNPEWQRVGHARMLRRFVSERGSIAGQGAFVLSG